MTLIRFSQQELMLLAQAAELVAYHSRELRFGLYDPGVAQSIDEACRYLRRRLGLPGKTHRTYLDVNAITVCMFAVRLFCRELRKGDIPSLNWPSGISKTRLLARLEKHRKRAKRKWWSSNGQESYWQWGKGWTRFLASVRSKLRPVRTRILYDYFRRRLGLLVAIVRSVLVSETNETLSEERELRKLVRKMCRHIRRERAPVTMKDVLVCSDPGRAFIASYMLKLIAQSRVQDPSLDPSQPTLQPLSTA